MNETGGQLLKQGRFKQAIPILLIEMQMAEGVGLLTDIEKWGANGLLERLLNLMLSANYDEAQKLGESFMQLAMRIPGYLEEIDKTTFLDNVKLNYETA